MKSLETAKSSKIARMTIVAASAIVLTAGALVLSGCSTAAGEDVAARIDDLEARIKVLEDKVVTVTEEGIEASRKYSDHDDFATYEACLADIEKRVGEAVVATNPDKIPSDQADREGAYARAVKPFDDLEEDIDHLKDAYEAAHENGTVSDEELVELNAYSEKIYGDINMAEENLQDAYGIDD